MRLTLSVLAFAAGGSDTMGLSLAHALSFPESCGSISRRGASAGRIVIIPGGTLRRVAS
jgi:hypothetical protein